MDSLTFLDRLKWNLGFKHLNFVRSVHSFFGWNIKFSNDVDSLVYYLIDDSPKEYKAMFTFPSQKQDFDELADAFAEELKGRFYKKHYNLYIEDNYRPAKLICSNPKSLEDILIQTELNKEYGQ